jgi:hypothetical protein
LVSSNFSCDGINSLCSLVATYRFSFLLDVCHWLATGWWFSPGTPVSSTYKTDRHDITEILLKVALTTINQTNQLQLHVCILKPVMFICNFLTKWSSGLENSTLRSSIVYIKKLLFLFWLQTHNSLFVIGFNKTNSWFHLQIYFVVILYFLMKYVFCQVFWCVLRLPRRDDICLVTHIYFDSLLYLSNNDYNRYPYRLYCIRRVTLEA